MFRRKPKHVHQWEVIGASFAAPIPGIHARGFIDIEALTRGVTTITQRCTECKYIDTTEHYGRVDLPGFRWRDRNGTSQEGR